ncbi:MAG: CHAT domain-containing protein, partial [Saprospiraceae bacterium]|nr:CHAT domain-containing protein [Saprospiraceae bacterium]
AGLYESMGEYDKALPLYLEAKENTEKALGKSHPEYGTCLNNLAFLYYIMGDYDKALPLYLEAKENAEKALGKSHPVYGACLNNLALLYQNMGNYDRALPLYLEAKENMEKALGKSHPEYGTCLNNLAVLYYIMGDYKALPLFFEAKENTEKTLGKSHPKYSTRLSNLAFLYYSKGQYDKALPLYLEAKENAEKVLGTPHPQYGVMLNNLTLLYHSTGDYDRALPLLRQALQNNYHQLNQSFSFLSEAEKEKFASTLIDNFEVYQSFFSDYQPQQPEVSGDAYDIELARKGMLLRAGIQMREALKVGGDTTAIALYDDWQARRRIIAAEGNKPIAERRADLPALEAEAEKMERELAQRSAPFRENKRLGTARWQDVQARLQPGEVAIEFAAFQYRSAKRWTDSTQYMALLLRPGMAHPEMIPLFEQRRLDGLLSRADSLTSSNPASLYRGGDPDDDNKQSSYGKELYELVFAPIQSRLQAGDSVIYFSPAGGLHRVAFAALPLEGNKRLMDRYRLVQLGSTSELLREASSQLPAGADIVLFGGMDYQPDTLAWTAAAGKVPGMIPFGRSWRNERYKDMGPFDPLSGALSEVESVARLAQGKGLRVAKYTGTEALIERYMALSGAGSPGILHIATHGFYLPAPETKRNDRLLMTGNDMAASTDNPLRRSGLAFAGAEHTRRGRLIPAGVSGDGFLTAANAAHVPLPNTRLVVLAACKTALGDLSTGEGVYGLQRAFKAAGAEYLLLSLWNVPDKETGEFMELFYTRLFGGQTIEAAFEATRKEMKRLYENMPEIWGAFVLVR